MCSKRRSFVLALLCILWVQCSLAWRLPSLTSPIRLQNYRSSYKHESAVQNKAISGTKLHISDVLMNAESFSSAFIGGTIGVLSVVIIVELRKTSDTRLEECPYCMGNGRILCGTCLGLRKDASTGCACSQCNGLGVVTCVNCKGDGRISPIMLQSRAVRDPEFATDSISIDSP